MTLKDADKIKEAIKKIAPVLARSDDIIKVIDSVPEVVIDTDTDTISRQQVIEEAKGWIEAVYCDHDEIRERMAIKHVINGIKELPTAGPQIIRCKECRHRDEFGCCKYWVGLTMGRRTLATDDEEFCSHAEK